MNLQNPFKRKGQFVSNSMAADCIEALAKDSLPDPYLWDDFESTEHTNPEARLALNLCWRIAKRWPARGSREYMAPEGNSRFIHVASLLRDGKLAPYTGLSDQDSKSGELPGELAEQIGIEPRIM